MIARKLRDVHRQNGLNGTTPMLPDWNVMSDDLQLAVTREALNLAAETIASQAELLAFEIESGGLNDRGGPDALRLLAAIVRVGDNIHPLSTVAGHA